MPDVPIAAQTITFGELRDFSIVQWGLVLLQWVQLWVFTPPSRCEDGFIRENDPVQEIRATGNLIKHVLREVNSRYLIWFFQSLHNMRSIIFVTFCFQTLSYGGDTDVQIVGKPSQWLLWIFFNASDNLLSINPSWSAAFRGKYSCFFEVFAPSLHVRILWCGPMLSVFGSEHPLHLCWALLLCIPEDNFCFDGVGKHSWKSRRQRRSSNSESKLSSLFIIDGVSMIQEWIILLNRNYLGTIWDQDHLNLVHSIGSY